MKVKIFQPGKNPMQSGRARRDGWVLEYETSSPRVPEPLMGWTGSEDTLNQVVLNFDTLEKAVAFADKKGWRYTVLPPRERKVRPRNYTDNFKFIPGEDHNGTE